jgi:tetratricopeptide (TPR) repeat protein
LANEWRKRVGPDDAGYRVDASYAAGAIAAAEGKWDSAASAFLAWNRSGYVGAVHVYNRGLVEAANALDRAGRPDSAIVLYERALALPSIAGGHYYEVAWYPAVLRRLGELHEALGHREQAVDYYLRFIDAWKDADPELQPQVRMVRERLARLGQETPSQPSHRINPSARADHLPSCGGGGDLSAQPIVCPGVN